MQTDRGGNAGPRSSRDGFGPGSSGFGGPEPYPQLERNMRDNGPIGVPPPVPGFGFPQFPPMPNGMPMFPPNFMPPAGFGQPPPPGAM